MKSTVLIEQLDLTEAQFDADARLLRNVVLIRAGMSSNRRLYSEHVLQSAASVFEGARAYANHPRGSERKEGRSVRDLTGWYANVRYENGALVADRYFANTEAGRDVLAIAQDIVDGRAPRGLAGLSINAIGEGEAKDAADGKAFEVSRITAALSVDDVDTPAAGGAYTLTASDGDALARELLASVSYEEWFESRPEYRKRLQNELKVVRQDDALKAVQAEAEAWRQRAEQAETQLTTTIAERDAALSERERKVLELAIVEALQKVKLPLKWQTSLREQLMRVPPSEWERVIDVEKQKAAQAGYKAPLPEVRGAGQQVMTPPVIMEGSSPLPRPGENAEQWARRMKRN